MGTTLKESLGFEDLINHHRSRSYGIHNVKGIRVLMIIKSYFIHPTWYNDHSWLHENKKNLVPKSHEQISTSSRIVHQCLTSQTSQTNKNKKGNHKLNY
jgi:hypothetical protein